jgi:hypothetical protein
MKTSKTHQRFAYLLGNQRALDCPEEFLGPNWRDVLNFWLYLDTLSLDQFAIVRVESVNLFAKYGDSVWRSAWNAACNTTNVAICNRIFMATSGANSSATRAWDNPAYATLELIGTYEFLEQGKSLTFVPLFMDL